MYDIENLILKVVTEKQFSFYNVNKNLYFKELRIKNKIKFQKTSLAKKKGKT